MSHESLAWHEPDFQGLIGVARRDITPPVGIYSRNWGAAKHDIAEGIHQRLFGGVISLRAASGDTPCYLIAIDATWFRDPDSCGLMLRAIAEGLGVPRDHVMLALSHTHAGPSISMGESSRPGGDLIEPYVRFVCSAMIEAGSVALAGESEAVLTVATGRCTLAANRDMPDPESDAELCGFNPRKPADDTLLVGRVTRCEDGQIIGTLVNYACHPTTLAWDNRLLSPDFVGSMRLVVEAATGGAPCLFLQGASGELAPRLQYGADVSVAESHGRSLGHAVLSTLEGMLPPNTQLRYQGKVSSGAPLAVWGLESRHAPSDFSITRVDIGIPLKDDLPTIEQVKAQLVECTTPDQRERLHRQLNVLRTMGDGPTTVRPVWLWRFGKVILLGHSDEAYSDLQRSLRADYPDCAMIIMNVVNGWGGYLCPLERCNRNLYQAKQSPYADGSLEIMIESCRHAVDAMAAQEVCREPV